MKPIWQKKTEQTQI